MILSKHDIKLVGEDVVKKLKENLNKRPLHLSTVFNRSFYEHSVFKPDLASPPSDAVAEALRNIAYAIVLDKELEKNISNTNYLFNDVVVISDGLYYVLDISYLDIYDYIYNKIYMVALSAVSKYITKWSFDIPYEHIPKLATHYNMIEIINKGIKYGCSHNPYYNIKTTAQVTYNNDDIHVNVLATYTLKEECNNDD